MKAVVLAAGQGTRLEPHTAHIPKCLVKVDGTPILDRAVARLEAVGIEHLIVVSGHCAGALGEHLRASSSELAVRAQVVFNPRYRDWGNFYSLLVARDAIGDSPFLKLDGDVVMDRGVLPAVLAAPGEGVLAIDASAALGAEEMKVRREGDYIVELNKRMPPAGAAGEFIGVERIGAELAPRVFAALQSLIDRGETGEYYERAYELLMFDGVRFGAADVSAFNWTEIDDLADLNRAAAMAAAGQL